MATASHKIIIALFLFISAFINLASPLDYQIDGQRKTLELLDKRMAKLNLNIAAKTSL